MISNIPELYATIFPNFGNISVREFFQEGHLGLQTKEKAIFFLVPILGANNHLFWFLFCGIYINF